MSRVMSQYPERVYSTGEEKEMLHLPKRGGMKKLPKGWMFAGLAGIGVAAWMVWHFGPDFIRYMKMERM